MVEKPACDIIIPVWNLLDQTRRCLESILSRTGVPYRLILVDNASEQPTADFLRGFQEAAPCPVVVIRNDENLGNIKAVNQGIQISEAPYVCILDNDTVVFPGWLEKMIRAAALREEIGIVNPASNDLGARKPWFRSWDSYAKMLAVREQGRVPELATVTGFCMLIKRAVINRIGGWCEDYGMGYFEDTDYSLRAAQAGFVCVGAQDAFVYHEGQASFRKKKRLKQELWARNRQLFESRFGSPKRIAYFLDKPTETVKTWVGAQSLQLARANHWIWIFSKAGYPASDFPKHGNISLVTLPKPFFVWNGVVHVLKKKKRFAHVSSDNAKLVQRLARLHRIHRAKVESLNP